MMLSAVNHQHDVIEERMPSAKKETEGAKMLSHAETKRLQDAARVKYKKAFDALKDK